VPCLQELAAADPSVHAALGGRSALAVRRGSEAEEVIRFVGFSFLFGFFFFSVSSGVVGGGLFGVLPFDVFVWLPRKMCKYFCIDSYWGFCFLLNYGCWSFT
jgi:hypothetical protein